MLRLFEVYGIDWRDIAEEDGSSQLADLRAIIQDRSSTARDPI